MMSSVRRRAAPVLLAQWNAAELGADRDCNCAAGLGRGALASPAVDLPPKAMRVGRGIRVVCGCGLFSLTFRNLKASRFGVFRCLICGWRQPMASLLEGPDLSDSVV